MATTPVCANCISGYHLPGTPAGSKELIVADQQPAYIATKATERGPDIVKKEAVVVLTDIFGMALPNPMIYADKLNEELKCDVLVMDLFVGGPPFTEKDLQPTLTDVPGQTPKGLAALWANLNYVRIVLSRLPGLIRNNPLSINPRIVTFLKTLKTEKFGYTDIGIIGFCLGGGSAVYISSLEGLVKTSVIAHPGGFSMNHIKSLKVPTCWIEPEEDVWASPKVQNEIEAILTQNRDKHPFEFTIYPGVTHGFATRPNLEIPRVKEAFEEAQQQAIEWFKKTL